MVFFVVTTFNVLLFIRNLFKTCFDLRHKKVKCTLKSRPFKSRTMLVRFAERQIYNLVHS